MDYVPMVDDVNEFGTIEIEGAKPRKKDEICKWGEVGTSGERVRTMRSGSFSNKYRYIYIWMYFYICLYTY
jgi:hypothetical protein